MNLNVLFEDNHILVVEKPSNIPVQADISGELDFQAICKRYLKEKYNKPGDVFCALVHRLDRPVSGVMVLARTSKAASRLSQSIRVRDFGKWYVARLNGILKKKSDELIHYLKKESKERKATVTDSKDSEAKLAKLKYHELFVKDGDSFVKIELETGRFHQIRAQFNAIGYSLYGDHKYGNIKPKSKELHLHSCALEFEHPVSKKIMKFESSPTWLIS